MSAYLCGFAPPFTRLNQGDKKKPRGKREPGHRKRSVHRTVVVKPSEVPAGSRFKGYADYIVQELEIKAETTRYRLEKWLAPEGKLITGKLPHEATAGHFGPTLRSFVLYQYYQAQVTEPLILEGLREWGVAISSGQLHRLIVDGKASFHQEKGEILKAGLRVSRYVHADDTGARHRGRNGYCTHIGNTSFA